jgi:hypothetical protein
MGSEAVKESLITKTQLLTKHMKERSTKTLITTSKPPSAGIFFLTKFKLFMRHLSCYPKAAYLPLLFLSFGTYGYHSVRATPLPVNETESTQTQENAFNDLTSFKKWIKSCLTSVIVDVFAGK